MKSNLPLATLTWYIKYFGLPLSFGVAMVSILGRIRERKRRTAVQGKVVVITGASSGIGEALSHVFYEYGSKVILASRRKSELDRVKNDLLAKKLSTSTEEPVVIELDLADLDHLDSFIQKVYDVCGQIDILINNGGVSHRGSILHSNMNVFQQIMRINYFGSVGLTKAVLPKMVERKSGHIVFVSSVQGLIAIPDRAAYAASKHAMQAFGDSLHSEMHQHNIHVTVISPGYVKTAVSLNALTATGDAHGVMDKSTAAGFSPEYVALKTLDGIANKDNDIIISQLVPRLAITLRRTSSSLYFWVMSKRAVKTP